MQISERFLDIVLSLFGDRVSEYKRVARNKIPINIFFMSKPLNVKINYTVLLSNHR